MPPVILHMSPDPVLIHLHENRRLEESDGFRRYQGVRVSDFLLGIDDDTMAAATSQEFVWDKDQQILLLPVTGEMICNQVPVKPGELFFINLAAGEKLIIQNPYNKELINYLLIRHGDFSAAVPVLISFAMEENRVRWLNAGNTFPSLAIGKFGGRKKGVWQNRSGKALYAFVVEGAFEVEDRLLHARDGLSLGLIPAIEWEALSNDAILLLLEMPL